MDFNATFFFVCSVWSKMTKTEFQKREAVLNTRHLMQMECSHVTRPFCCVHPFQALNPFIWL